MPFSSDAQRRFMYAKHPRIAARWSEHTPKGKDLPEHVKKAVDAALQTLALPAVMTAPTLATPSLAKLKASATRKISADLSGEDIAAQLKQHARPDSDFRPDQLAKGIEVEREHSESLPVRKAITKGHLTEFDTYYDPLAKMEDELKAGKTAAYGLGVQAALAKLGNVARNPLEVTRDKLKHAAVSNRVVGTAALSLLGAGIGSLAAGPENRGRGAIMGAGTGAGIALGGHARRLGNQLPTTRLQKNLLELAGSGAGGAGGYLLGRAIAPERTRA